MIQVRPISISKVVEMVINVIPELRFIKKSSLNAIGVQGDAKGGKEGFSAFLEAMGCISCWNELKNRIQQTDLMLQYFWVMSHTLTMVGTIGYFCHLVGLAALNARNCILWYNLATYSSVVTYGLVIYRHTMLIISTKDATKAEDKRSRTGLDDTLVAEEVIMGEDLVPLSAIMKSENTHLLAMALLAIVSTKNMFKITSFFIYSFMNLLNYLMTECYRHSSLSKALMPLFNYMEDPLLSAAAMIDIFGMGVYLKEFLMGSDKAYALVMYSTIYGLRLESSESCRIALHQTLNITYKTLVFLHTPSFILEYWQRLLSLSDAMVPSLSYTKPSKPEVEEISETSESVVQPNRIMSLNFDTIDIVNDIDEMDDMTSTLIDNS